MEGQKRPQLGKNMKVRGAAVKTGENDDLGNIATDNHEGHGAALSVPESNLSDPSSLVAEEADAATTVQVENVTVSAENQGVAVNAEIGQIEPVSEATEFDRLMNLMEQSRQQSLAVDLVGHGLVIPTPEEIEAVQQGGLILPPQVEWTDAKRQAFEELKLRYPLYKVDTETGKMEVIYEDKGIGPQPNGDYGVVVMIPEQLVSGVLGQSELDGVTPGEWLTPRLAELLEGWFHGA